MFYVPCETLSNSVFEHYEGVSTLIVLNTKEDSLKNVGNRTVDVATDFHVMEKNSKMANVN